MKIGILGGTFDPIHNGHLEIAVQAQKQAGLGKVIFVPVYIAPHKNGRDVHAGASDRYNMVVCAVKSYPDFEASDEEIKRRGISYTADTLESFHRRYPEDELFLIIGSDSLRELPKWRRPDRILELAGLIVAPRPASPAKNPFQKPVLTLQMKEVNVAATDIRKRLGRGERLAEDSMPAAVMDYIESHGLYGRSARV